MLVRVPAAGLGEAGRPRSVTPTASSSRFDARRRSPKGKTWRTGC
ncbi:putative extensin [Iris pallida]|uniref:Extensin n=1 Tax=Iris pallida TaxID=29817 RepID=A0AAX6EXW3_IRIPA|nr:putative extensin [Iris pallida]